MRFIETVAPREAGGLVGRVYGEVKHDFALLRDPDGNSPFLAHSPHPELLAGMWSVLYETVLVEGAVRPVLVVVGLVVSQHPQEMALIPDQGAVEQLPPASADP